MSPEDASVAFMTATNDYLSKVERLAVGLSASAPGTAAVLRALAEQNAGRALDVLQVWPG